MPDGYYATGAMETIVVIPARYGSTRFPGKPLTRIEGKSLIERVWAIARVVPGVRRVLVATDDERIASHVRDLGGEAVLTSPDCANGSERVHEAIRKIGAATNTVVNLQGDAALMPPWVLGALVEEMRRDPSVRIATPAARLSKDQLERMAATKSQGIVSGTTVTFDRKGDAMYFSKAIIPFSRTTPEGPWSPVYQHIGVYAYTMEALEQYVSLEPGRLEAVEQLEQLRALEHGIPVRVVEVSLRGRTIWSVDNPQDVARCEEIIRNEGELA